VVVVVVVDVVVDVVGDGDGDGDGLCATRNMGSLSALRVQPGTWVPSVQPGTWVPFQTRHMGYVGETSGGVEDILGAKILRPGPA